MVVNEVVGRLDEMLRGKESFKVHGTLHILVE